MFYIKSQNSSLLATSILIMGHLLPKQKNVPPDFLYVVLSMANYQKINKKFKKCWGKINSFLPWTQNWNWTLRPSFYAQVQNSCTWQYNFRITFDFGTNQDCVQTRLKMLFSLKTTSKTDNSDKDWCLKTEAND